MDTLAPGLWSCFALHEDGTWLQPTYRIEKEVSEEDFCSRVLAEYGRKFFIVLAIGEDHACPEEDAQELLALGEGPAIPPPPKVDLTTLDPDTTCRLVFLDGTEITTKLSALKLQQGAAHERLESALPPQANGPACGHSVCSQHYIDTGSRQCVSLICTHCADIRGDADVSIGEACCDPECDGTYRHPDALGSEQIG